MGISTVNLKGRSGTVYTLQIYEYGTSFNAVGTVYAVTNRAPLTTSHTFLYVGQTGDLSYRFDNHHRATEFERKNATHACVLRVDNEQQRIAVERDLMDYYSLPCNRT